MSALDIQIDGEHYKNVKIQPIELAYKLGASPAFCKLAKYISRQKNDKKINLQKAIHCIQLEKELDSKYTPYCLSKEYALINYIEDWRDNISEFCNQYTKNDHMCHALICMYGSDYDLAIKYVVEYASSLGIDL